MKNLYEYGGDPKFLHGFVRILGGSDTPKKERGNVKYATLIFNMHVLKTSFHNFHNQHHNDLVSAFEDRQITEV